jgi:hypothetical protein
VVQAFALGDLNQDRRHDLITAVYWDYCGPGCDPDPGGGIALLARADGRFAVPGAGYGHGSGNLGSVTIADVNGDGRPDAIARLWNSRETWVWLGTGDGTFQAAEHVVRLTAPAAWISALTVGDFTGDGRSDIAAIYATSPRGAAVAVLPGDGAGNFRSQGPAQPLEEGLTAMAAADFNRDGRLDLVVRNYRSPSAIVLLGAGDGSFRPPADVGADSVPPGGLVFLALGDFNHDGVPDFANAAADTVAVFLGRGDGSFGPPTLYRVPTHSLLGLVAADLDGNGSLDLVLTRDVDAVASGQPAALVLRGNCDGTFQSIQEVEAARGVPRGRGLAAGDVDGDGKPDLAFCDALGEISVVLNRTY